MRAVRTLPELLDPATLPVGPAAPALSDGSDRLTYGEYAQQAGRLAGALAALGVRPGDRVGVHLRKSVHSFVAVHGALRAGAVVVPIDPLAPVDGAVSVLRDAGATTVVTDGRASSLGAMADRAGIRAAVVRATAEVPTVDGVASIPWSALDEIEEAPLSNPSPDDDAYIIYTSGSTGRPKGIVHSHRSALAYVRLAASAYGLHSDDRLANIAGLHFDQSTFELYVAPFVGAAVTVVPDPVLRFPASVSELVERERVTVWYSVPYVLRQLVTRGALEARDLSSIRWVLYGGEAYPPGELRELMHALPTATVSNVYGPAEVNQCMRFDLDEPPTGDQPVPIGRAWGETELAVVDPSGEPVRDGPGELLVATTTMMSRYWGSSELTSEAFVDKRFPSSSSTRWYRTGDLVMANGDGDLIFLGRADNQVKIRGQRVELEAIDLTIRSLEGVSEVATVAIDDDLGEGRLVAVIQNEPGASIELRDVQRAVGARHPRAAVPVDIVVVDRLTRTATAKVDRNAALEHAVIAGRR